MPPHHTILLPQYSTLLQPPPLFFPVIPASGPLPPHLLQQCKLPRSHNPLSWPGSLALTTVHPMTLMAYEESILFTLKGKGNTHSNTNQYICVIAWYQRVIAQRKGQHNLNVEDVHIDNYCLFVETTCPSLGIFFKHSRESVNYLILNHWVRMASVHV